jgi:hypothetical protein
MSVAVTATGYAEGNENFVLVSWLRPSFSSSSLCSGFAFRGRDRRHDEYDQTGIQAVASTVARSFDSSDPSELP